MQDVSISVQPFLAFLSARFSLRFFFATFFTDFSLPSFSFDMMLVLKGDPTFRSIRHWTLADSINKLLTNIAQNIRFLHRFDGR